MQLTFGDAETPGQRKQTWREWVLAEVDQVVPVVQSEGSSQREEFHSKVTGKTGAQLSAYWSKLVFSGQASPPKEVPGAADVKSLVSANPNMIGYIDSAAVDASVKVVFTP